MVDEDDDGGGGYGGGGGDGGLCKGDYICGRIKKDINTTQLTCN